MPPNSRHTRVRSLSGCCNIARTGTLRIRFPIRQIEGEIAWQRLQRAKIEVTVGDDEVKAVIDKMNASKGTEEFRVGEIFLPTPPGGEAQTIENANKILDQLKNGASFAGYARQYSQSSSAAVGGDLGWMRPELLPEPLANVLRQMGPGQISNPIANSGGVPILAVQDTRKILTRDPRDAVLSLKQVSITFPKGRKATFSSAFESSRPTPIRWPRSRFSSRRSASAVAGSWSPTRSCGRSRPTTS